MCVCVHSIKYICIWKPGDDRGTIPQEVSTLFFWDLELSNRTGQPIPRSYLPLPLSCWDHKCAPPCLDFFMWILGCWSQVLMLYTTCTFLAELSVKSKSTTFLRVLWCLFWESCIVDTQWSGFNENSLHRLICLNDWSSLRGTVGKGSGAVALLEQVWH